MTKMVQPIVGHLGRNGPFVFCGVFGVEGVHRVAGGKVEFVGFEDAVFAVELDYDAVGVVWGLEFDSTAFDVVQWAFGSEDV